MQQAAPSAACAGRPGWPAGRLHNRTTEDACPERSDRNVDAYLKRQIMGREAVVAVTNGRLDFGTWERISCGEFDGRPSFPGAG